MQEKKTKITDSLFQDFSFSLLGRDVNNKRCLWFFCCCCFLLGCFFVVVVWGFLGFGGGGVGFFVVVVLGFVWGFFFALVCSKHSEVV